MPIRTQTPYLRCCAPFLLLMLSVILAGAASTKSALNKPATLPPDSLRDTMETTIMKVKPALVRIHAVSVDFESGHEVKREDFGSGVVITRQGYVITNHHVAGNARQMTCTLATKEEIDAELVGTDPLSDIAVLRLTPKTPRNFTYATFGNSSALRVGDRVFAMGSPLAFSQSVTMGVVSNTELIMPEVFGEDALTLDGENVGTLVRWIGHDAQIFPGNSGGPLVNAQGEIVGINEISIGLGGAIPGNLAAEIARQLIAQGHVQRASLGLAVQPLLRSSTVKRGVLITDTEPNSSADKAGFHAGDILVKLNGRPVDVNFKEELPPFNQQVMSLPIGKPVSAVVIRAGKELTLQVVPTERVDARKPSREFKQWGMTACNVTNAHNKKVDNGVRVTSLRPGGPADNAKPSMNAGDIILEINGSPVRDLTTFADMADKLNGDGHEQTPVTVAFERDDERYLTVVKIGTPDAGYPSREIRKAWLPVSQQVLTGDLAAALGLGEQTGVRITQVYAGTSAEKAGLKVGDIVVALDGTAIAASQPEDTDVLPSMIRQYKVDSTVELTIIRDKATLKIPVQLPKSPMLPREMPQYRDENYDFSVRDIAFLDRIHNDWHADQTGIIIMSVNEGGWAALGRVKTGDLLVAVNGAPVASVAQMAPIMAGIAKSRPEIIILQVKRDNVNLFLELQGSWQQGRH